MKNHYFISIIPPSPLKERLHEMKLQIRERYGSSHSLNAPPHITLVRPFHLEEEQEERLAARLSDIAGSFAPFEIELNGFSSFPAGVIYVDVVENPPLLDLQEKLEEMAVADADISITRSPHSWRPHLTLASRDLDKTDFHRARKEFEQKSFEATFTADRISLLRHDGREWKVSSAFPF